MIEGTDSTIALERACSLASEAMFTVALQCRRLKTVEPEDEVFVMRWWADLQFLILALCRLRRSVKIACKVPLIANDAKIAIRRFDQVLPHLTKLRNVGEHIDEYATDNGLRHDKTVNRKDIQVGSWNGTIYEWLGVQFNVHDALIAAEELYASLQAVRKS